MDLEIKKAVGKILMLCIEANKIPGLDVFYTYSGHVNSFHIYINQNTKYETDEEHNRIYNKDIYIKHSTIEEFNEIISDLTGYLIPEIETEI